MVVQREQPRTLYEDVSPTKTAPRRNNLKRYKVQKCSDGIAYDGFIKMMTTLQVFM